MSSWLAVYPLDTVKAKLQATPAPLGGPAAPGEQQSLKLGACESCCIQSPAPGTGRVQHVGAGWLVIQDEHQPEHEGSSRAVTNGLQVCGSVAVTLCSRGQLVPHCLHPHAAAACWRA